VTLHTPQDTRDEGTRLRDAPLGDEELRAYAIGSGGAVLVGRQPLGIQGQSSAASAVGVTRAKIDEGALRVLALAEAPQ
jgi:hypothetical protein